MLLLLWIQELYNMEGTNYPCTLYTILPLFTSPTLHYVSEQHLKPDQVHNHDHSKKQLKLKRIFNIKLNATMSLRLQQWNISELSAE